jgi:transcriptional regulator with XRE-family HTH domain
MTDLVELGELIRRTRKAKGLNQTELGRAAACSRSKIDEVEHARAADIGLSLMLRIMNALDLDLIPGPYNAGRPTLEQLQREEQEVENAPRMG